jgi:hypothetical protein
MDWDRLSMIVLIRPDLIDFVSESTSYLDVEKVVFLLQLPELSGERTKLQDCLWDLKPGPRAKINRIRITASGTLGY